MAEARAQGGAARTKGAAWPFGSARSRGSRGALLTLLVLSAGFALAAEGFASAANLSNIAAQSSILLLLALPMTLIIMTEGLDLSMGAVLTLANVLFAAVAVATGSMGAAFGTALLVGAAFGVVNGVLVAWLGIPPFVATLGTLGVAQGMALVVTDGQSIVGLPDALQPLYGGTLLGLPTPVWFALGATAVFAAVLQRTAFGACVHALGGNREALTLAGRSVRAWLVAVYGIGGLMCGLAALLLTARINSGHPTAALGMEFDAIAAVALGGTSFERGRGTLAGTVVGVLLIGTLRNGLNLLGLPSAVQVSAIGLTVIAALAVDAWRARAR